MKQLLAANVPCLAFLAAAVYLLKLGHPVAGGWSLAAAILACHTVSMEKGKST